MFCPPPVGAAATHALPAADTNEFVPAGFSVTEGTTRHLAGTGAAPADASKV